MMTQEYARRLAKLLKPDLVSFWTPQDRGRDGGGTWHSFMSTNYDPYMTLWLEFSDDDRWLWIRLSFNPKNRMETDLLDTQLRAQLEAIPGLVLIQVLVKDEAYHIFLDVDETTIRPAELKKALMTLRKWLDDLLGLPWPKLPVDCCPCCGVIPG